ncbi:MAG TPA: transglycosylase SLT domain-containing protein [Gemmatimonadaceae bacterium]|nr:transglycosylase SLT domain-containing protein [Gemmatimonadaceae bacterium]
MESPGVQDSTSAAPEHREKKDRRLEPSEGRRADRKKVARRRRLERIGWDILIVVAAVAAIGYTASVMRPIYAGRAPVVGDVLNRVAPAEQPNAQQAAAAAADAAARSMPSGPVADSIRAIEASPEFAEQQKRFASDLVRTGRMAPERADSVARYAVREAFLRGIPPAVIFGIMLTENAQFISKAKSNVGAVGLMQVYPKVWLKALSQKFGARDIAADSTNLRYGIFILQTYLKPGSMKDTHVVSTEPGTLMKGLLHYNGCVHGTNTPRCHTYPNKVQQFVERDAEALCGSQSFYQCIAKPFMAGLLGKNTE